MPLWPAARPRPRHSLPPQFWWERSQRILTFSIPRDKSVKHTIKFVSDSWQPNKMYRQKMCQNVWKYLPEKQGINYFIGGFKSIKICTLLPFSPSFMKIFLKCFCVPWIELKLPPASYSRASLHCPVAARWIITFARCIVAMYIKMFRSRWLMLTAIKFLCYIII